MKLIDIVERVPVPGPWEEGTNIPWNDPAFSKRMLEQHLSQDHDRASRQLDVIDRHVEWIHEILLKGEPGRVLDLCCGPGLYTSRLASLGHECVGVDFSPASIEYARNLAAERGVTAEHVLGDVREVDAGGGFDLVMLIFGELNIFPRADAVSIIAKAHSALTPSGVLLLEPQRYDGIKERGEAPSTWYSSAGGLFSESPHICLSESFWDEDSQTTTTRFYVVDATGANVERQAMAVQAYTDADYAGLLSEGGFDGGDFLDTLPGTTGDSSSELLAIVARKAA